LNIEVTTLTKSGDPHPVWRVLTAVVAIPLVVLITIFAANVIFAAIIGVVSILAAEEFFSLGVKRSIGRPGRWFLAAVGGVSMSFLAGRGGGSNATVFGAVVRRSVVLLPTSMGKTITQANEEIGSFISRPRTV